MLEQLLLDGVAVEPGDRAQPARDGRPRPAIALHVTTETFDVGAAGLEQVQSVLLAPSSEHSQVQRIGVAGQPAIAGEEPHERGPFGFGEQRFDRHDKFGRRDGDGHGDLLSSGRNRSVRSRGLRRRIKAHARTAAS